MSNRIKLEVLLGAVVVAAVACNNEIAPPTSQLWASRVRGTIRGPSGQVAANANVTVVSLAIDATNAATLGPCSGSSGGTFTTTTDANGRFVVQLLGVGGPSLMCLLVTATGSGSTANLTGSAAVDSVLIGPGADSVDVSVILK